jgi:hypothetical protein
MSTAAQLLVLVVAAGGLGVVVYLVRRGSLKERFAVLWLAVGTALIVIALARPLLDALSDQLGIEGTTTLFLGGILFLLALVLHLSVIVSRLEGQVRDIAEAHALLEHQLATSGEVAPPVGPSDEG